MRIQTSLKIKELHESCRKNATSLFASPIGLSEKPPDLGIDIDLGIDTGIDIDIEIEIDIDFHIATDIYT